MAERLLIQFRAARFVMSTPDPRSLPTDEGAEIAFAGRSNAGKSSALNAIVDQGSLARISKTPGRTQHLVVFGLNEHQRLIDLPGYGYARVPHAVRDAWHQMIDTYVESRRALRAMVIVSDIRHALTEFDTQMLAWCGARSLPALLLLSKADKLNRGPALAAKRSVDAQVAKLGATAQSLVFSANARTGVQEARAALADWLN
jgi:GTP-binding protein